MNTLYIRECDRLDGSSNFIPWKFMLQMLLEEAKIWDHVKKEMATHIDLKLMVFHVKNEAKVKRIILDLDKGHFIPHIVKNTTNNNMFEALIGLYQIYCVSRHILLRKKLAFICMSKMDTMVRHLSKITLLRD
jgi:hypothetical protein